MHLMDIIRWRFIHRRSPFIKYIWNPGVRQDLCKEKINAMFLLVAERVDTIHKKRSYSFQSTKVPAPRRESFYTWFLLYTYFRDGKNKLDKQTFQAKTKRRDHEKMEKKGYICYNITYHYPRRFHGGVDAIYIYIFCKTEGGVYV